MLKVLTSICLLCAALVSNAYSYAVIFGDSLSDEGNFYAATNGAVPPSPPYFNGRFSNGPVWSEYAYTVRQNFAFGGAMTNYENLFEAKLPPSMHAQTGLQAQIRQFEELVYAPEALDDTMAYINIGSNDVFYLMQQPDLTPYDLIEFVDEMVERIDLSVVHLRRSGVKHITVMGLSDLTLTPRFSALIAENPALGDAMQYMIRQFNARLYILATIKGLEYFKMKEFMYEVMGNAEVFGFTNITEACLDETTSPPTVCANPEEYFFWDDIHPTTSVHQIFAEALYEE